MNNIKMAECEHQAGNLIFKPGDLALVIINQKNSQDEDEIHSFAEGQTDTVEMFIQLIGTLESVSANEYDEEDGFFVARIFQECDSQKSYLELLCRTPFLEAVTVACINFNADFTIDFTPVPGAGYYRGEGSMSGWLHLERGRGYNQLKWIPALEASPGELQDKAASSAMLPDKCADAVSRAGAQLVNGQPMAATFADLREVRQICAGL